MEDFELGELLHTDAGFSLKVFRASSQRWAGQLVVKQYHCDDMKKGGVLLHWAVLAAYRPFPYWGALREVVLAPVARKRPKAGFTVNFVFETFVSELPGEALQSDALMSYPISEFQITKTFYQRKDTGLSVSLADIEGREMILKVSGNLHEVDQANELVMEGIVQAHVYHKHTVSLEGLLLLPEAKGFKVALAFEKMSSDVEQDAATRRSESRPYTEPELLTFLFQSSAGLVHAKTKNIAHRDIKPANIFLDSNGVYKIGDFGSAWMRSKAKSSEERSAFQQLPLAGRELSSETQGVAGTLAYMSPEMNLSMLTDGMSVDPFASDMYSLGIALLELATLAQPKRLEMTDVDAMQRDLFSQVEAVAYSDFIKTLLREMLATNPNDRLTIEELHVRVGVQSGQFQPKQRDDWENMEQVQLAVEEQKGKSEVLKYEPAGPSPELAMAYCYLSGIYHAQNKFARATEFLEKAKGVAIPELPESEASATSYSALAKLYRKVKLQSFALEFAQKALRLHLKLQPSNEAAVVEDYSVVIDLLREVGNLQEAKEQAGALLALRRQTRPESHPDVADALEILVSILTDLGQLPEALKLLHEALTIKQSTLPASDPAVAASHYRISKHLFRIGDFALALEHARTDLRLQRDSADLQTLLEAYDSIYFQQRVFPEDVKPYPLTTFAAARSILNIAHIHHRMGAYQEAYQYAKKVEQILANAHSESIFEDIEVYESLSELYQLLGVFTYAANSTRTCLELAKPKLPEGHSALTLLRKKLIQQDRESGDAIMSAQDAKEALKAWQSMLPESHPDIVQVHCDLAEFHSKCGKFPVALEHAQKALKYRADCLPADHPEIAACLAALAQAHLGLKQYPEALDHAQKALQVYQVSPRHLSLIASYRLLADVHKAMEQSPAAVQFAEMEVKTAEAASDQSCVGAAYDHAAEVYRAAGSLQEAVDLLQKAVACHPTCVLDLQPQLARHRTLVTLYLEMQRLPEALTHALEALEITKLADYNLECERVCKLTAKLYRDMGRLAEAEEPLRKALYCSFVDQPGRLRDSRTCESLAEIFREVGDAEKADALEEEALQHSNAYGDEDEEDVEEEGEEGEEGEAGEEGKEGEEGEEGEEEQADEES